MYADDMLILSKSEWGLKRSLLILEAYCKKWRLVINTTKTKIMIFNKRTPTVFSFKIDGKQLDIAKEYMYRGINICCSGSFVPAISSASMQGLVQNNVLFEKSKL